MDMPKAAKKAPRPNPVAMPDIEVIDAHVNDEHALVSEDVSKLRAFMGGMVAFFTKAGALETAAKERLMEARQVKERYRTTLPENKDVDLSLQNDLLACKRERKVMNEHWIITQLLSQLHKRTVAGRERGGGMLDECVEIYQDITNRFGREQQRIADAENARRRREAEEAEQKRRDDEQRQLEEEVLKREAAAADLSERERSFVNYFALAIYSTCGNPVKAAERASYRDPETAAAKLMASPKIRAAITALQEAEAIKQQAAAKREEPVNIVVDVVKPDVAKAAGSRATTSQKAEVFDADAFLAAVLDPKQRLALGIPVEVITIDQSKMNEQAKQHGVLINRWPGVRLATGRSLS